MKQLTQNLKDGHMELPEVPYPALNKGTVLVRNHYSVISTGTEGKTVKDARLGYIGKAKARKEEVKKVVEAAKTHGVKKTYKMVKDKLESPSPLGYSCAGMVIAVADDIKDIKAGDLVACGGSTANHSEIVAVPRMLCTPFRKEISPRHAAFTTIGSIAMQGIRQADLSIGENAVVIGLGIVGQLTMQILQAGGIDPVGIDIDHKQVELAKKCGFKNVFIRDDEQLEDRVNQLCEGVGTDAVIITAGTSSTDPVNLAGTLARKKGKVVIVGAVPTGFKRKNYYNKELELRMSSSYGPGRHDADYEEKGRDYPHAYVRWTENRNMKSFIRLLEKQQLDLEPLITHDFDFEQAPDAYQLIMDKTEHFSGIVLKYDSSAELSSQPVQLSEKKHKASAINTGFIGAGSFARNFLLPALRNKATLIGVATARPANARNIAEKYGFDFCTGKGDEIINNKDINTIFIATRHNLHAEYVIKGLEAGKNIFVEKPLCMTHEELEQIKEAESKSKGQVMVGFNRRFAPLVQRIAEHTGASLPISVNYRINAGHVPADHWTQDPEVGGGRIIGELCHFIDLCRYLSKSKIADIDAKAMKSEPRLNDTLHVSISFENGSIATVNYFSNGNKKVPKEQLEVFSGGSVFQLDDFTQMFHISGTGKKRHRSQGQDKGHEEEVRQFTEAVRQGKELPVPFAEICETTEAVFKVIHALKK